ncbi:uncharacterized protein LOC106674040 isoform X1 [Cimex lectularius]|uniref:Secreted protein n=1 Tax=Cimex lectularius TaxID=79782 RepID=A0A8I6SAB8_CIMLE|nr:uncharacterized protein LOC106674040 isoform X1 [Cimex lectularius]
MKIAIVLFSLIGLALSGEIGQRIYRESQGGTDTVCLEFKSANRPPSRICGTPQSVNRETLSSAQVEAGHNGRSVAEKLTHTPTINFESPNGIPMGLTGLASFNGQMASIPAQFTGRSISREDGRTIFIPPYGLRPQNPSIQRSSAGVPRMNSNCNENSENSPIDATANKEQRMSEQMPLQLGDPSAQNLQIGNAYGSLSRGISPFTAGLTALHFPNLFYSNLNEMIMRLHEDTKKMTQESNRKIQQLEEIIQNHLRTETPTGRAPLSKETVSEQNLNRTLSTMPKKIIRTDNKQ